MRVLTAAEMREVDRRTISLGIPDAVLMENAGHRVVEFLDKRFAPLNQHRIVILCGKGNNGGDGIVVARQLFTRFRPASLDVVLADPAAAPENLRSLEACGFAGIAREITPAMRAATIVVDALLGTGLNGLPRAPYLEWIHQVNTGFPAARIVAVDIPSGMQSDSAVTDWPHVRAHHTVTFTAPKVGMVMEPNASACGELVVGPIGSPESILPAHTRLTTPRDFARLLAPRAPDAHKGTFGHVITAGGAAGKSGAVMMTGLAALRAGAGLVTVASDSTTLASISSHTPELMTEVLDRTTFLKLAAGKRAVAIGPGLGVSSTKSTWMTKVVSALEVATVVDADGINNLAGVKLPRRANLILTPHPGEMQRLTGVLPKAEERLPHARAFAQENGVTLVLKGRNTLAAFPDGTVWINPTGGPAMATGGSGDILTGLIAGLAAQFPQWLPQAVIAAVWLHGRAGDVAAAELGEPCVIATDLLRYLPAAMKEAAAAL
ncbi:MAG: NAD(P)H-hydrate dehydratase [Acidobacteria bacterium]|nr:NAD(P)H-hydrate dehydratase [Acidobacteriota bacterium]